MTWMMQRPRIAYAAESGDGGRLDLKRPLVPGIPSRVVDPSGVVKRRELGPTRPQARDEAASHGDGDLVVGEGIYLSGEIRSCRTLVVQGTVEAHVPSRALRVGEGGRFGGSAEVEEAEIAGQFEGTLTVSGKLTITETGRLQGTVRYGELAIAPGGRIAGDVDVVGKRPAIPAKALSRFTESSATDAAKPAVADPPRRQAPSRQSDATAPRRREFAETDA